MCETTTHAPIIAGARESAVTPHLARLRWLLGMLWRARYKFVGLALLLEAAVGLPATIAMFVGYDATSVLIVALAATWGAFVMAVACTIREVSRSEAESHALPGTS